MMRFSSKKNQPFFIHGMNTSKNLINKPFIKPEILEKIDNLLKSDISQSDSDNSQSENISYLSNTMNRVSILEFIRKSRKVANGYIEAFNR